jgi:hypothetical protein
MKQKDVNISIGILGAGFTYSFLISASNNVTVAATPFQLARGSMLFFFGAFTAYATYRLIKIDDV